MSKAVAERRVAATDRSAERRHAVVPTWALLIGCLALAALSLELPAPLGGHLPMGYDPWGWSIWGREVLQLRLDTTGSPSWKPLPVLFTTLFAPFGDAAPALWLVTARAGGLLGLALTYRLAARLAGPAAGVLAAVALVLTPDVEARWIRHVVQGNVEPLLIGLCLWAVERWLDGRRDHAVVLLTLAALARPEVWPFLGLAGLVVWRRDPSRRWLVALVPALLALLWFGADWWGSSGPLTGVERARVLRGDEDRTADALRTVAQMVIAPVWVAAAVAVLWAARQRDRVVLGLTAGVAAWTTLVVAMAAALGFAALSRFVAPPAAVVCVLAGAGVVRLVAAVPGRAARAVAVLVLVGAMAVGAVPRVMALRQQAVEVSYRAALQADLDRAVAQPAVARAVGRCGDVATDLSYITGRPALAWRLGLPVAAVHHHGGRRPGVVFAIAGGRLDRRLAAMSDAATDELDRVGRWRVVAVGCPALAAGVEAPRESG